MCRQQRLRGDFEGGPGTRPASAPLYWTMGWWVLPLVAKHGSAGDFLPALAETHQRASVRSNRVVAAWQAAISGSVSLGAAMACLAYLAVYMSFLLNGRLIAIPVSK